MELCVSFLVSGVGKLVLLDRSVLCKECDLIEIKKGCSKSDYSAEVLFRRFYRLLVWEMKWSKI